MSISRKGTGSGVACAQYGEIFQGAIEAADKRIHRCLVSLKCEHLSSKAVFYLGDPGPVLVDPPHKQKAQRAAVCALEYCGSGGYGGRLTIESNIEEGKGCGSSTADCTATVLAISAATGRSLSEREVAQLVVEAEIASDNIMFGSSALFAHREGIVLEDFERPLPSMRVVGTDTDPGGIVETLKHPRARYSSRQIELFRVLIAALRRAIRGGDAALLGRVSTACAVINEQFLPKRCFTELQGLSERVGALGLTAAHSGTVVGILLDSADPAVDTKTEILLEQLSRLGLHRTILFHT